MNIKNSHLQKNNFHLAVKSVSNIMYIYNEINAFVQFP